MTTDEQIAIGAVRVLAESIADQLEELAESVDDLKTESEALGARADIVLLPGVARRASGRMKADAARIRKVLEDGGIG